VSAPTVAGSLQERARTALADHRAEQDAQAAQHAKYEDDRRRSDLLSAIQRRLRLEVPASYVRRDPELEGAAAYTVIVDSLRFRAMRSYGGYDADELQVALTCPKCGEPVWVEVAGLADLGAKLEDGAGHQVCPEEARRQEDLEEAASAAAPPRPRPPTHGEQLVDLIRSIALDALQREE
jgi:hypothetical protein